MNKSSPRAIRTRSVISLRPYLVINLRDVFTAAETFFISLSVPLILLDDATVCKEMRSLLSLLDAFVQFTPNMCIVSSFLCNWDARVCLDSIKPSVILVAVCTRSLLSFLLQSLISQ